MVRDLRSRLLSAGLGLCLSAVPGTAGETVRYIPQPDGTTLIQIIGDPGPEEPGFDDVGGGSAPSEPSPRPEDLVEDRNCRPENFKVSGSRFFWLHFCPSRAGWASFERVSAVIDDAWLAVSERFGSQYDTKVKGYIYTNGSHYHGQTGGPAWSGGFYSPVENQMHVPAPPGETGFGLKLLLAHELTHFRLEQLTMDSRTGEGRIRGFRFVNEGIAQRMEERIVAATRRADPEARIAPGHDTRRAKLWYLKRGLEQGHPMIPYKAMVHRVAGDPGFYYAQSWATMAFLEESWGERTTDLLLSEIAAGRSLADAFRSATGLGLDDLLGRVETWARAEAAREFGG